MKTIKQHVGTLFFVLAGFVAAQAQENLKILTFENAVQLMAEQNPALMQSKQQIKQKEYELKAKRGLYLPHISIGAKVVTMADPVTFDLSPVRDAILPLYNTLGNYGVFSGVPNPDPATNQLVPVLPDNISTKVVRGELLKGAEQVANAEWEDVIQEKNFATVSTDLVWPIFTGGKIMAANNAAGVEVEMSRDELKVTEGNLFTELVTRYYGLALNIEVQKLRRQIVDVMKQHHSNAQKLFDNGMIAKTELLHANVSLNEAERELKQASRNIDIARAGLEATLAFDTVVAVQPASNLFINREIQQVENWVPVAMANNPQMKQIQSKKELIDIKSKADKGSYLPTVAMFGTYNVIDKDLSPYIPDWMVGVGLKWTVFEGLSRNNHINVNETMQSQVGFAELKANADLKAYITKLYQELQMQMEQNTELESTLVLANEYANSTEKAFAEGLATSIAVVDAQAKVAQVKTLRLKLFYDYDVALARLLQTAGVPEEFVNYCSGENTIFE